MGTKIDIDILDTLISNCYDLCETDPEFEDQLFSMSVLNHTVLMDEEWFINSTELERHMYTLELAIAQQIATGFVMKNYDLKTEADAWDKYEDEIWDFIDTNSSMIKYLFGAYFVSDLIGKIPSTIDSDKLQ